MRYRLTDIPALLLTPLGRWQFYQGVQHHLWPVLSRLALLHRRTLARRPRVIAVIGSFGKSTTTRAVSAALGVPIDPRFAANCWSRLALAILRIRPSQEHAVLEVAIGDRGEMARYARLIRPDVVVVTSIGSEHNRTLGRVEITRAEKAEMLKALRPSGTAVLNGDDPNVIWMGSQTEAKIVTFGLGESNDFSATDVRFYWPRGTRFVLRADGQRHEVFVRLIGAHMVDANLAAVAVAHVEGYALCDVLPRLAELAPTTGRMQPFGLPNGAWILRDDAKSAVETVHAALDVLGKVPARRKFVALGSLAEVEGRDRPVYRDVGRRVAEIASKAVFIGTNYRLYKAGARLAGLDGERVLDAGRSPRRAAELLRPHLEPGDVVLVKGRLVQHLERVALHLLGRNVRCDIDYCQARCRCEDCPMLERGWEGRRPVV